MPGHNHCNIFMQNCSLNQLINLFLGCMLSVWWFFFSDFSVLGRFILFDAVPHVQYARVCMIDIAQLYGITILKLPCRQITLDQQRINVNRLIQCWFFVYSTVSAGWVSFKYNDNSPSNDTSHPYISCLMCLNIIAKC